MTEPVGHNEATEQTPDVWDENFQRCLSEAGTRISALLVLAQAELVSADERHDAVAYARWYERRNRLDEAIGLLGGLRG